MRRKRYSKNKLIIGCFVFAAAIALFGVLLYFAENRLRQSEGKGDSGSWKNETYGTVTLTIDDQGYSYTDDVDAYLIIGTDGSADQPDAEKGFNGSLADFITVMIVNRTSGAYGFLQLDRDTITFVPIPDENGEETGTVYEQLCTAHWYGYTEEQRNQNTVNAVSRLLGNLPIKGYYTLNMKDLPVLNRALGGVTVTIEEDMTSVDPQMKQGAEILLSDDQVEGYLRARMTVGDGTNAGRMRRQRQYMQNAYGIVMQNLSKDPDYINEIYDEMTEVVDSNLPRKEISRIAAQVRESENRGILTLDGTSRIGDRLDDGQKHAEFYVKYPSIVEQLGKLIALNKE